MELSILGNQAQRAAVRAREGSDQRITLDPRNATLNLLGMSLIEIPLEGEERRKLSSNRAVAVLMVDRSLEAYRGGVRNGDIIAEVNSVKIRNISGLKKMLSQHDPHDPLFVFLLNTDGWRFTNLSFIRFVSDRNQQ
jgi:S1-C subfamily serine protease